MIPSVLTLTTDARRGSSLAGRLLLLATALLALILPSLSAAAQSLEAEPAAAKAFAEVLAAYRSHPWLEVKMTTTVTVKDGSAARDGTPVTAELKVARAKDGSRRAVLTQNGFTCWSIPAGADGGEAGGKLFVIHESNPHSYFTMDDDDSPYYALMNCFVDLPFPDLALALGNDAATDVIMQLHPRAPWIQPTAVEEVTIEGAPMKKIVFASEIEKGELIVDPKSMLPKTMDMSISGGNMVRDGASITYKHTFAYVVAEAAPDPKMLEFAPGDRQRVDVIASLVKPKEGDADQENGGVAGGAAGDLVGRPAPDFVLATLDGKAVDLEDYRGRVVVLDFWATWCGPCRAALPALHEVAAWAKDAQLPVTVLTINAFERAENPDAVLKTVREFWQSAKHTLPVALDFTGQIAGAYGVEGIPASFIIRSDGVVHAQHVGAAPAAVLKDEITEALKALEK